MKRKTLIWLTEDGETYLGYRDRYNKGVEAADATLEQLADMCDLEAESANAHDFVGSHRLLAALLYRHVGRERATAILREVAELGGLDGMNGVCTDGDAFKELGIAGPWKEWRLLP